MTYFQSLTKADLEELLKPFSLKSERQARYRAKQIFHWVYQRGALEWDEMTDLAKDLRIWLRENVTLYRLEQKHSSQAMDGTQKFLWSLEDQKTIESVVIPAALQNEVEVEEGPHELAGRSVQEDFHSKNWRRLTACISSQVGCAMGCKFCLTGIQGLDRHLKVHEIVTQVYELRRLAPISNVVFMGMGEPLHNLENVIKACQILIDPDGLGLSRRKVTVSTSGIVPAIEELGKNVPVSLAISLNAPNDEKRSQIMPINKKWNIESLLKVCKNYPLGHRRITFEYVLIKDFNDGLEDAAQLAKIVRGIPCKINLIPMNEHSGSPYRRPPDAKVKEFQKYLLDRDFTATVRISRGRDILAACGQLRSLFGTARGTEKYKDISL